MNSKAAASDAAAADGRFLMRSARAAALATIDAVSGDPHASLVTVATESDGTPLFLISALATHTRNIRKTPRASLLFDGTAGFADRLEGSRLTVTGAARPTADADARRRFLACNPTATRYAGFADFELFRLEIERGHFVGGFGRICEMAPDALLVPPETSRALAAAEADIVSHMNEDHADAVELYAVALLGAPPGAWRMTGCDADGCDLRLDDRLARLRFPRPAGSRNAVRETLVELARRARSVQEGR